MAVFKNTPGFAGTVPSNWRPVSYFTGSHGQVAQGMVAGLVVIQHGRRPWEDPREAFTKLITPIRSSNPLQYFCVCHPGLSVD